MERLNEESVRLVQQNRESYKKMLERSRRDHEIQKRYNKQIHENKKQQFKKAVTFFLAGAVCATVLTGVNKIQSEFEKSAKFQTYYDDGDYIIRQNTYRVNPTETGVAYHNDKIAKEILKNEESCHEKKREDDTKYLIAGVSEAMPYNRTYNMNQVISHLNNEDFKNWEEYLAYLGYDSYEEYIAGIKDELGAKNNGRRS